MNNFEQVRQENLLKPEDLVLDKHYKIQAPYTRGEYEGQAYDGEVKFLGTDNYNGEIVYRFKYIKHPEHSDSVGISSTYICKEDSLKYIKDLN